MLRIALGAKLKKITGCHELRPNVGKDGHTQTQVKMDMGNGPLSATVSYPELILVEYN